MSRPNGDFSEPFPDGAYVLAASVLDTFNPDTIRPLIPEQGTDSSSHEAAFDALLSNAVATQTGESSFAWRLSDETRKQAISFLYSNNLLEHAIRLNTDAVVERNEYQNIFEMFATGQKPALEGQSLEELQASLQAIRLLGNTELDLPDERKVASMVLRESALEELRRLADAHFTGRERELETLEEFVDAMPSSSLWRRLMRSAGNLVSDLLGKREVVQRWPLLVTGRGGIGKSAFLAKFLLDHITRVDDGTLAFAYLDFDRTAIWPDEPLTLLADIALQLSNQIPAVSAPLLDMHGRIVEELAEGQSFTADYDSYESFGGSNLSASRAPRYTDEFEKILSEVFSRRSSITLLLLMDTFEEVTQRGTAYVDALWSFMEKLQDVLPRLRVVISGRSGLPNDIPHGLLELPPLDKRTVNALLRSYGLTDQRNIDAITERVGGHPLSVKLTVQLLQSMARNGGTLDECARDRLFEEKWNQKLVDGVLYRRIVDHIDDPLVKKLANPGFALREVTPQILLDVLNGPCDLRLGSLEEAKGLFSKLARYNSLVSPRSEWILHHRPEIREMVLDKLLLASHQQCLDIWKNAVDFYSAQYTIRARAEELYYRMMLGASSDQLDERWIPGVEKHLMGTRAELPQGAREFLEYRVLLSDQRDQSGPRTSQASSRDTSQASSRALRTVQEMKRALALARPERALEIYQSNHKEEIPDPTGPLFPLVARAHAQLRDFDRSLDMVERGLSWLERERLSASPEYLDLLLLQTQVVLLAGREMPTRGSMRANSWNLSASAEKIWERFGAQLELRTDDYQLFRIGIYVLELLELDEGELLLDVSSVFESGRDCGEGADYLGYQPAYVRACAAAELDLLEHIHFESEDADALLLLRAFAWLGGYFPERPPVYQLMLRREVGNVITTQYSDLLKEDELHEYGSDALRDAIASGDYANHNDASGRPFPFPMQDAWLLALLLKRRIQTQERSSIVATHSTRRRR
ncbi:hypothetical protein [Paraburkholderia sp.]|uniref:hypothetical protein n=1 Tax=Paraburkholderia sp. TaxID=1926495 RepID=UPI0039E28277